jgi:DNA-binding transcriptional LysR family regulator
MREMNLRSIDLNLLTILQILLEEKHVTRAAERLHMSQSAVSRALQRLRLVFNDPLLVKSAEGYSLSSRALKLSTELTLILQTISGLIQEPEFNPLKVAATLRFAGIDLDACIDMPTFMHQVLDQAPALKIEVSTIPADYFTQLSKGQVDFFVSGIKPNKHSENLHSKHLSCSELAILLGKQNPLADQCIDLNTYLQAMHGYVAITGKGPALLDDHLESIGLKRNVVLKLSDMRSVVEYCEKTNILFMLPVVAISNLLAGRNIVTKPLPRELKCPDASFYLYWHARFHKDPLHCWIREMLISQVIP